MGRKEASKAQYIIGIDLGTTNCTLSYACKGQSVGEREIKLFEIGQITAAGEYHEEPMLPSTIYFPLDEELDRGAAALPWDKDRPYCVGRWARDRGEELAHRVITSAKSWLSHGGIDRRTILLPAGAPAEEGGYGMSPLEAMKALLVHLREAWDYKMSEEALFTEQEIFVTVPASFDPAARTLVEEAAELAGYPKVVLIEEPLAAFYAWLHRYEDSWRSQVAVGDTILVVDIGGGTTDFSTIVVSEKEGALELERQAVGAHLLLGGDNIDLLAAYLAEEQFTEKGIVLDEGQQKALVHVCRRAKESLLGGEPPKEADVTLVGRGRKLVGGTVKTKLASATVSEAILEAFFPIVSASDQAAEERRGGLQQVGLPYAREARVTAQLARFLAMKGEGCTTGATDNFVMPAAILFNGGTLRSGHLRTRLHEQVESWKRELLGDQEEKGVTLLEGADYDYAVSRGAVYYGFAREGHAVRIKAGTAHSYFIAIEEAAPAIPGRAPKIFGVCIVPKGMEEGSEAVLDGQQFALVVGEEAAFRFFSHGTAELSDGTLPQVGTVVKALDKELTELEPIVTAMSRGEEDGKVVRVTLHSKVTELGTLELWCQAPDGRRWQLQFDLRAQEPALATAR